MNIEVPTKYPVSQDRIVVLKFVSTTKARCSTHQRFMTTRNALSLARRALKVKFSTPTVPLTTILQNRQVFLPDPVQAPMSQADGLSLQLADRGVTFIRNVGADLPN
jgi:hypothetical protein